MKYLLITAALITIIQYFKPTFFLNTVKYIGYDEETAGFTRRVPSIFTWGDFNFELYISYCFASIYSILIVEYRKNKLMSILLPILAAIVVFISQLRIAMVTYLIATLVLVFKKLTLKSVFYIILLTSAFYVLTNFLSFNVDYFIENRLKSESALTRIEAFKAFYFAFPEKPYFGTGGIRTEALIEGFGREAQLHNVHLAIAYYYGIFAGILHTLFIIYLTKRTYKTGKDAKYWPPFVSMLCYIAATMTLPSAYFFVPGLIFIMVFNKYYYDQYLQKKLTTNLM